MLQISSFDVLLYLCSRALVSEIFSFRIKSVLVEIDWSLHLFVSSYGMHVFCWNFFVLQFILDCVLVESNPSTLQYTEKIIRVVKAIIRMFS